MRKLIFLVAAAATVAACGRDTTYEEGGEVDTVDTTGALLPDLDVDLTRDTVNVPIGKNRVYTDRINSLYFNLLSQSGRKKQAKQAALKKLRQAFESERLALNRDQHRVGCGEHVQRDQSE